MFEDFREEFPACKSSFSSVPLFLWRSSHYSASIPRCYNDVYVNSFSPLTAKTLESSVYRMLFLAYDLSSLKSRVNKHLLPLFFKQLQHTFNFFFFFM